MSASVESIDAVRNAFNTLLTNLTPAQVMTLAQQLQSSSPAPSASSPAASIETESIASPVQMTGNVNMGNSRTFNRTRINPHARKRPTNSYMVYRAFYSPQLGHLTQKEKSGLLSKMWQQEERKAMFALLAQAHTDLRDNHSDFVSFEKFLKAATPLLPVIPAEVYMATMGWEVSSDCNGVAVLTRFSKGSSHEYPLQTNFSARDIVQYCYRVGLVSRSSRLVTRTRYGAGSDRTLMAPFAANPSTPGPLASNDQAKIQITVQAAVQAPAPEDPAITQRLTAPIVNPHDLPVFDFNDLRTGANHVPQMSDVVREQQRAFDSYPFATHFHPDLPAVVGWDPSQVQDDFDPFTFDLEEIFKFDI